MREEPALQRVPTLKKRESAADAPMPGEGERRNFEIAMNPNYVAEKTSTILRNLSSEGTSTPSSTLPFMKKAASAAPHAPSTFGAAAPLRRSRVFNEGTDGGGGIRRDK